MSFPAKHSSTKQLSIDVTAKKCSLFKKFHSFLLTLLESISFRKYVPKLYYRGKESFTSWQGGLLTILQVALTVAISVSVFQVPFQRSQYTLTSTTASFSSLDVSQITLKDYFFGEDYKDTSLPIVGYPASINETKDERCQSQVKVKFQEADGTMIEQGPMQLQFLLCQFQIHLNKLNYADKSITIFLFIRFYAGKQAQIMTRQPMTLIDALSRLGGILAILNFSLIIGIVNQKLFTRSLNRDIQISLRAQHFNKRCETLDSTQDFKLQVGHHSRVPSSLSLQTERSKDIIDNNFQVDFSSQKPKYPPPEELFSFDSLLRLQIEKIGGSSHQNQLPQSDFISNITGEVEGQAKEFSSIMKLQDFEETTSVSKQQYKRQKRESSEDVKGLKYSNQIMFQDIFTNLAERGE